MLIPPKGVDVMPLLTETISPPTMPASAVSLCFAETSIMCGTRGNKEVARGNPYFPWWHVGATLPPLKKVTCVANGLGRRPCFLLLCDYVWRCAVRSGTACDIVPSPSPISFLLPADCRIEKFSADIANLPAAVRVKEINCKFRFFATYTIRTRYTSQPVTAAHSSRAASSNYHCVDPVKRRNSASRTHGRLTDTSLTCMLERSLSEVNTGSSARAHVACRTSFDLGLMPLLLVLRACCACMPAWHGTTLCTERS